MAQAAKKAATLAHEVERELADTTARIEQERNRREAALLADDGNALDQIELTLSRLQRAQGRQQERLRLLQQQVQQEEAEAVAKRQHALRERIAKKLAERDADAVELQNVIATGLVLFRKIIDTSETVRAAWPIGNSHTNAAAGSPEGAALSGAAIKALLSFEFYWISADPFLGGVPGERRQQSLPGAVSPRIDQQLEPNKIVPFAEALKRASAFAVETMANLDPLRALTPGEAVAPVDGDARTAGEVRLAALLRQQAELANDVTPAGEAKYMEVVAELARLSNEPQSGANKQ